MTDLHERFRSLDRVPAPYLWDEARRRAEQPVPTVSVEHAAVMRPTTLGPRIASPLRGTALLIALASLLIAGLIGTLAVAGALNDQQAPILPPSLTSRPANGLIAISANPNDVGGGENGDIYLVAEGAAARRIIGSVGDGLAQSCPRFSPDGRRLAYGEARASGPVTTFRGNWPVWDRAVVVVGLDDNGVVSAPIVRVSLPAETDPGKIPCPEWSPDGKHLALRSGFDLWVADAASGETTVFPLFQAPWEPQAYEWSHDGSRIAVAEPGHIRLLRIDGGASTLVPARGETPDHLGWTAGDRGISYIEKVGFDGLDVNVVGVDGAADTRLTIESTDPRILFDAAVVSPDGARVAYAQHTLRCTVDSCNSDPERLLVADTDGSNVVELAIPYGFGTSGLEWSPDGGRLLLGSIGGVVSVALTPGSPPIVHSSGELDLEWSGSEVTWQPVYP